MPIPKLELPKRADKDTILDAVEDYLNQSQLEISDVDPDRPWGGFFVIAKDSEAKFIETFFPEVDEKNLYMYGNELSPKILIVGPNEKLSWQYHNRRAELWKAITPAGFLDSNTDEQPEKHTELSTGELVQHANQVRHRLIGLDVWGVVAEIWQHTDAKKPSNEKDIVRLEDNYGRN